jgi:hypothetical protein
LVAVLALVAPGAAWGLAFKPSSLPAAKVGVRYQVVIRVSQNGHHPALGRNFPSFTIDCFGADASGGFIDDCKKLPPGLKLKQYTDATCSPPLQKPACIVIAGTPKKAGRYTFRISVPNVNSASVLGILRTYTIVVHS